MILTLQVTHNNIYCSNDCVNDVVPSLSKSAKKLFQWFSDNQMKGNTDNCNSILSKESDAEIRVGKNTTCEKLLGVKTDQHLNFDDHVKSICKKASGKLRALARVIPYMSVEKRKLIMNSLFNTQFNHFPLIWILHIRCNNNKIKHLHERCLRLIYNDKRSSSEDLLTKVESVSILHRNIQDVAIEMFKVKTSLAPKIVNDLFDNETENYYNLRHRRIQNTFR